MITEKYCNEILQQYPEYITKDQMYRICHISKKTCLFLLESGLVPNIDSGKKTRRFKIKTVDVIQYLKDRDDYPELFKAPDGFYKGKGGDKKAPSFDEVFTQEDLIRMRQYYERLLKNNPDVMSVEQVAQFTGYNKNSVSRWCGKKELKCFYIKQRYQIPKEYRRYATIRSLSAKKCMRTFRLGAEYDKEALQDRLLENQRDIRVTRRYFEFMRPYTREYARKNPPTEKYYRQRDFYLHLPRVTGYLSFFRCVAIVLGVAPLYEKEYRQPLSAECREACRRLDRFTAEITLVCREHLDTPEDVQRFLARMDREMDAISAARSKIRNKQRGCADPVERGELKKSCAACTAELSRLRKQKQTAYNMIEDNPKLKDLLACEWDVWVENDPYLSPREKQVLRNQQPSQEDKTIIR